MCRKSAVISRVLLFVSICSPAMVHAEKTDRGVGVYFDQDLLVPLYNEDRDYTMGLAVEFFSERKSGLYPFDKLVSEAGEWLGMDELQHHIDYSYMFGTLAYTPDDLADPMPIYTDRPYSSLVYLSNKRMRANDRHAVAAELLLGVLGTNVAKEVQTTLHRMYREANNSLEPVEPQGWSHQISDGGELTIRLRLLSSMMHEAVSKPGRWDVASTTGVSLGFQTNVHAGLAVRAGNINSEFWSLAFDPVNRGSLLPSNATNEWYVWSAFRAYVIAYDVLLQGQFRHSDVTYSAAEIERLVYHGAFGLTAGLYGSQITLSANSRSPELKNTDRRQIWGSINYTLRF